MNPRDQALVPQGRPRGRPRVEEPGSAVTTWLPASVHDRLIRIAEHREVKVSALVRQILILRLK
jgi:hypothetical protein